MDTSAQKPPTARKPRKSATWAKPRIPEPQVPQEAKAAGVQVSDIPPALIPTPPPASELVKVGEVMGQDIYAQSSVIRRAEQLRTNLGDTKKDGTPRYWPQDALTATILAFRLGGKMTYRQIAEALHMSERHVLRLAKRGSKDLVMEREIARLDSEGMPIAVENVLEGLEQKDKEYTLEYLKGRGVLGKKVETSGTGPSGTAVGLVVRFEHTGQVNSEIRAGAIAASPNLKVLDGEVQAR